MRWSVVPDSWTSRPPVRQAAAIGVLCLVALILGLNAWLISGALVPLHWQRDGDYLLLAPRLPVLAAEIAVALLLLSILWWLLARRSSDAVADSSARRATPAAVLTPLLLLAFPIVAVGLLATPLRHLARPWLFLGIDLQWLLVTVALLLAARELSGGTVRAPEWLQRVRTSRRSWLELWLAALLIATSLLFSPGLRFQAMLFGDEPKYVRYLENWYRGRGFDIENIAPLSELPPDEPSHLWRNVALVGPALAQVASDLGQDLRHVLDPEVPASPRSPRGKDTFIPGKRGGVYQIHGPGMSLMLLPGYLIDRALLLRPGEYSDEFPLFIYGTQASVLLLYALWGVLVFRFLSWWTGRVALSWTLAAVAMVSQPVASYAYQYYPEVLAGCVIAVLARSLLTAEGRAADVRLWHGLLVGYLPWIHVRFGLVVLVAAAAVLLARRDLKRLVPFAVGLLVPLVALAVYDYHVTGRPWPLFLLDDVELFYPSHVVRGLLGFAFDRYWGLVGLAPIYLLALAGVWPAARRQPAALALLVALVLGLAVPAAGHGWKGGAATPMRLVVSLVPLGMALVAESWMAAGDSRWARAVFTVLTVLSIENGLTLNSHHARPVPDLADQSVSAWKPALLLPDFDRVDWPTDPLLWIWLALSVALVVWSIYALRRAKSSATPAASHVRWTAACAVSILLVGTIGSITAAATGVAWLDRYAMPEDQARRQAATYILSKPRAFSWSAFQGRVPAASLIPNPRDYDLEIDVAPRTVEVGQEVSISVAAIGRREQSVWGRVAVEFDDGTPLHGLPFFRRVSLQHTFDRPGRYHVTAVLAPMGRPAVEREFTVTVRRARAERTD